MSTEEDRHKMRDAIGLTWEIIPQSAFEGLRGVELLSGPK
jgi:hypothetical protein